MSSPYWYLFIDGRSPTTIHNHESKRMCPAEIFASVEIYTYLARLMQKFFILPEDRLVFDASIPYKFMMQPGRHKFRCVPRAPSLS
ncbi:hypothetical protein MTO96_040441 [Rhipicephalus appendiculatus]